MARPNPFLSAELLRRDRSAQFALGKDIRIEEEEEERLEEERARQVRRRGRRSSTARGVGRIAGGIAGFLIGGPAGSAALGTALGSYAGQRAGRFLAEGKKFKRISAGTYYVAGGERRERQFRTDETERRRYINELMLAKAATDAITGYRAGKYGSGILDMLLGNTPAQRASDPSRNVEIFRQSAGY